MNPPYYAVIFTSIRTNSDSEGYLEMAIKMEELAQQQDGFLGVESAREDIGITVSYWKDLASIKNWKENLDHIEAQQKGIAIWYEKYKVRIALVEREYEI
jgi:heme-degrading monooxygenase HmoA